MWSASTHPFTARFDTHQLFEVFECLGALSLEPLQPTEALLNVANKLLGVFDLPLVVLLSSHI